jgi:DNA topoisomerase II
MVYKDVSYKPALLKLYNDILVNAAEPRPHRPRTTCININIRDNGTISILNTGCAAPIDFIPCIFGNEPPPNNFKLTGYSVKVVNILSNNFYVEAGNPTLKKAVKVEWLSNMNIQKPPSYLPYDEPHPAYTKVCFTLDLERFGLNKLSPDLISLMERRAYDIAGMMRIKVIYNSCTVMFANLLEYARLFVPDDDLVF